MEQLRYLGSLTEKTAPGRPLGYTLAHLLYTLVYVQDSKVGRKQLAEELRLGEGTVRTMLKRLVDERLISIDRGGIMLSENGENLIRIISEKLEWGVFPNTSITVDEHNFMVFVRGVAGNVRYGVEQRDRALIHGARGASTLIRENGRWMLPGLEETVDQEIERFLDAFSPVDGDVVVIGSSCDMLSAMLGSFAAAFDLV